MVDVFHIGPGIGSRHGSTGIKTVGKPSGIRPKYGYKGTKTKPKMRPYSPYDLNMSALDEEIKRAERLARLRKKRKTRTA